MIINDNLGSYVLLKLWNQMWLIEFQGEILSEGI